MAIELRCGVCGGPPGACNSAPNPGTGVKVYRQGREDHMKSTVLLSTSRVYLTPDKTRVAKSGEPRGPLLVGEGCAIDETVAAHYGIDTYEGTAVSRVPVSEAAERAAMVTTGTGTDTRITYENMKAAREIRETVRENPVNAANAGSAQQAALMTAGLVNQATGNTGESYTNEIAVPQNMRSQNSAAPATQQAIESVVEAQGSRTKQIGGPVASVEEEESPEDSAFRKLSEEEDETGKPE